MDAVRYLRLEEIIQAFTELGGESDWNKIEKLVTKKRGGIYAPYLDWRNYYNTMFQLVQQHCEGYEKFVGPIYFEKVHKGRFRLIKTRLEEKSTSVHSAERTEDIPQANSDRLSPVAVDIAEPPPRLPTELYRILRDTKLAREIKLKHGYNCQICHGTPLKLSDSTLYAEVHHIKPLGSPHDGPDISENILCVCPNCHVLLDYGAIILDFDQLSISSSHKIGHEYTDYHNHDIYGKVKITG